MAIQPTMLRPPAPRPAWQVAVGLALILPAFVLLLTSYVEPAIWTVRSSFNRFTGLRSTTGGENVGFDNYSRAFDAGLGRGFGFALSLAVLPLLVVLLLAPALAWAADRGGRAGRWVTRGLLTIPLAAFAPLGIALARRAQDLGKDDPSARVAYWLGTFGAVTAVAVTVYLAAFRRRDPTRNPWPAVAVAAVLGVLAVIAASLQDFTYSYVYGQGNAGRDTPARLMVESSLVRFDFGTGAAVSTMLLLPLVLFGVIATVLIVLTGLRLEVDDRAPQPAVQRNPVAWTVGGILLLITLVATWSGIGPFLTHLTDDSPGLTESTWVNTWLPPLVSTLIGVTVAVLAAFGISGLRPLGRHSEWLLLPFGLFLFVGVTPLALRAFAAGMTADRLNSFLGLIPPSRVAIPAMFVLAMLFRGQALRRETLHQEGRPMSWAAVILPALPMLGLAYLATWLVQAQNLLWPFITAGSAHLTAQFALLEAFNRFDFNHMPYGRLLPLWMFLLFLLAGVAAQLLYLDRVGLRLGRPERDHPPRT
jgi:ABC-type sugar transport system permease subunit